MAQLRLADTRTLGRTAQRVALLGGDLVVRVTLVCGCLPARVGLLHGDIVLGVGSDTIDFSVSLHLCQCGVGFLYADILGIPGKVVTPLLRDVVSRFGAYNARI